VSQAAGEPPEAAEPIRAGLLVVLLLALVAAIYAPALAGGFLFDDHYIVLGSPLVESLKPLKAYFLQPFFTNSAGVALVQSYYRPLVILSFAAQYQWFAGNAAALHATNIALHLLNTLLFYLWLRKRKLGAQSAVVLAALWSLYPRLTEAVAWVSGRTDVLAASFVLGALLVWRPSNGRRALAALLIFLGLLAKETALAGALALIAEEGVAARERGESGWVRRGLIASAPIGTALAAYAALRAYAVGLKGDVISIGVVRRLEAIFEAIARYALALLDPWQPDAVQGSLGRPVWALGLLGVALVIVMALATHRFRHHFRAQAIPALLLFAAGLGLSLHLIPIPSRMVSADRFLYLPLLGLLAWGGPALSRAWRRSAALRVVTALLIVSFGIATFRRSQKWADEISFWVDQYRRSSDVTRYVSAVELGAVFYREGLYAPGLALSRRAMASDARSTVDAQYNVALCLARSGRAQEARQVFQDLRAHDRRPGAYVTDLALLDLQELHFEDAAKKLYSLVSTQPQARSRKLLARATELGAIYQRLQQSDFGSSSRGLLLKAELFSELRRIDEAVALWRRVLAETADAEAARRALGYLIELGDIATIQDSIRVFDRRFGNAPADLRNAAEVRSDELDRALAAKRELGL
jgi:tetratricopeptide (TPR) repeat protein